MKKYEETEIEEKKDQRWSYSQASGYEEKRVVRWFLTVFPKKKMKSMK